MNLVTAFIIRDSAIERTYRLQLIIKMATVFFQLAIFFYISKYLQKPEYFAFLLVGIVFSRFFQFWLSIITENLRQEQYWGTAELLFLAPADPLRVILSSAAGKLALLIAELAVYLVIGRYVFSVGVNFSWPLVLTAVLNAVAFGGLGLLSASCILRFKRGDPVNWLVAGSIDLLSGVYFPLTVFPEPVQVFARILPTTVALDAWRAVLLSGSAPSINILLTLTAWALLFSLFGILAFNRSFSRARKAGDIGSY